MATQRKTNGQFARGWSGGPGRPRRKLEAERLLLQQISKLLRSPQRFPHGLRRAMYRLLVAIAGGPDQGMACAALSLAIDFAAEAAGISMEPRKR